MTQYGLVLQQLLPRDLPPGRVRHSHLFWTHDDINILRTNNIGAI